MINTNKMDQKTFFLKKLNNSSKIDQTRILLELRFGIPSLKYNRGLKESGLGLLPEPNFLEGIGSGKKPKPM